MLAAVALVAVAVMLLDAGRAAAMTVYGGSRALGGGGGCLHDPSLVPSSAPGCPGVAVGLAEAAAVAVSPDGANVYVAAGDDVLALARNRASGAVRPALSPSGRACTGASFGGPCAARDLALYGADALAVSPDGRFVYVGASDSAAVSAFARGPHGILTALGASLGGRKPAKRWFGCVMGAPLTGFPRHECAAGVDALNGVDALALSPDGRFLYAVSAGLEPGEDSVVTLRRDPHSGALRPLPANRGCLQSLPGSDCRALAGLEGASAISLSSDGRFVYVASAVSGAVRAFVRSASSGALTPLYGPGGCISSGVRASHDAPCETTLPELAGARSLVLSPDGRELYVAAFDPGAVVALQRDPAAGTLSLPPPACLQAESTQSCPAGLTFLRGAAGVAVAPSGSPVYVAGESGNSLVELAPNPADGSLGLVSEIPASAGGLNGPAALALSPRGDDLYVVSPFDDALSGYATRQ